MKKFYSWYKKHITAAIFFWQTVSNRYLPSQALSEAFT